MTTVGHWARHEAATEASAWIVAFLRAVNPA